MDFKHKPVLYKEVIEGLSIKSEGVYVDGTLGGGGHASMILEKLGEDGVLIGIDRDTDALAAAEEKLKGFKQKKIFIHDNYSNIKKILDDLEIKTIDGALLDIGVSSFQLDNVNRGFSYMQTAALDMRMDRSSGLTAEDIVNEYSESELRKIIKDYGEERWAARIAKFIVDARKDRRLQDSDDLVKIIKAAIPKAARVDGPHPAKRTFQALRIEVNDELEELKKGLTDFVDRLSAGGRLAVITFHSLEDRIVKETFADLENPCSCPPKLPVCVCGKESLGRRVTGKPVTASEEELENNHRSRSAKLRIFEKK